MSDQASLLVIDKPAGMTSHDVVARVRRLVGTRRVGHAGTLDPMATGVLVLGVNRATKLLTYIVGSDKEYLATIRLGASTTTDDAEGEVLTSADCGDVTADRVDEAMESLRGEILQVPSSVSAIKVDGKRAYQRVRSGEQVTLVARPVTVSRLEIVSDRRTDGFLDVDVTVTCSSGTYIRALARDLGASLGVGGHLTALRRTRVGPWQIDRATTLPELAPLSVDEVCQELFPLMPITDDEAAKFRNGQAPTRATEKLAEGTVVALTQSDQSVAGLARARHGKLKTEFVAHPAGGE